MKEITLHNGMKTQVDDDDFEYLSQFKWRAQMGGKLIYAARLTFVNKKAGRILMHREIMQAPQGTIVDHINRDSLYNLRSNLRIASKAENNLNTHLTPRNKSGFRGVCWDKAVGKWSAFIRLDKKSTYLGRFEIIEEAARAYDKANWNHYKDPSFLNFPQDYTNVPTLSALS